MAEKIGFVGVGRMGSNMARRLKECGHEIAAVYDVNTAGAQALAQELSCQAADQLQQVTKASDVIITVVTDDKAMKKIYNGGLLSRAKGKLRSEEHTSELQSLAYLVCRLLLEKKKKKKTKLKSATTMNINIRRT